MTMSQSEPWVWNIAWRFYKFIPMAVAQNSTGGVTWVLVHVSTSQGSILVVFFEPQPKRVMPKTAE